MDNINKTKIIFCGKNKEKCLLKRKYTIWNGMNQNDYWAVENFGISYNNRDMKTFAYYDGSCDVVALQLNAKMFHRK